ncbi:MAG: double-stranded uracil-DNA glycosylase [Mycobacterium sp.]|nr:double-stranded uracil-DNA glycosylase [Mycobacterium sp.]
MAQFEPDILTEGLDVVFCGLNYAASAVQDGYHFSHRNNRFWPVLHLAGFTEVRLQPADQRRLLDYGCGVTAVVRRPTRSASEVSPAEFRCARPEFEAKIHRYAPRMVAFLGKRALACMVGASDVDWGRYSPGFAGTGAWVVPNPSGLNIGFSLDQLVDSYSALRQALSTPEAQIPRQ